MPHQFNVIVKQTVEREVNVTVDANTESDALELARLAMKDGDWTTETIIDEHVERNMMLDEEVDNELMRIADQHNRLPR